MSASLTDDVLQDDVVVDLARAVAAANKQARSMGIDIRQSLISITQGFENGQYWRINYGPKNYIGRRGGDLVVDVNAADATVKRTLRGQ